VAVPVEDPYLDALIGRLSQASQLAASPVVAAAPLTQAAAVSEPVSEMPPPAAEPAVAETVAAPAARRPRESRVEHLRQPLPPLRTAADLNKLAFTPAVPVTLDDAKLTRSPVQALVLKYLMYHISATGRDICEQIKLPFCLVEKLLFQLKADQLVVHKGAAPLADYVYQLTLAGQEDARRSNRHCSYFGSAPVHLDDYIASVTAQSVTRRPLSIEELDAAFADLLIDPTVKNQVGQALYAGHGFFIYGSPGNGKTSIAERVGLAYGETIWIPRSIGIDGEIVRLFDPCKHVEVPILPEEQIDIRSIDQRWVRIRRPTIVVGGELTLDRLEVTVNKETGTGEAPLQLKSNCGTLVVDDFGRQRISTTELLNRWIVPLDKRHDFLSLRSGKTIEVPFDQILVFSTNIEPKDLVDEAFLRRIPYKIEVFDPSEAEFRKLFEMYAERLGLTYSATAVDYVIEWHYKRCGRPFRFCHARDLLLHIRNYCQFNRLPTEMSSKGFDIAARNYFAVMGG
jgi:hypothetical protein